MKTVPLNAKQAHRSGRSIALPILHSETGRGWVDSTKPWPL